MSTTPPYCRRSSAFIVALLIGALPTAPNAYAQSAPSAARKSYAIAAGSLEDTLTRYAADAGIALSFAPALVAGLRSPGLNGVYEGEQGLRQLLRGSGLEAQARGDGSYTLRQLPAPPAIHGNEVELSPVTVRAEGEQARGPLVGYVARRSATATKTDTPLIETPQSISVVGAEQAEAIGATRLREALAYTPGINILPFGADSRYDSWIYLRGFDAVTPGYYLDGLAMRNAGTWSVWRTENYALERYEVLRGPSSVLYGQNSPGGMINVVSKQPAASTANEVQLQLGSDSRRQLAGDFTGALDDAGKALYRFTSVVRDAQLPTGDMDDDRIFLAPSFTFKLSDATTLDVNAQYLRDHAGVYSRGVPYAGSLIANPNGKISPKANFGDSSSALFDHDQTLFGYRLQHQLNDVWQLTQALRWGKMDVDYRGVSPGAFVTVNSADANDPANFRTLSQSAFGTREKVQGVTLDNQAQAKLKSGDWQHTLLFGVDYQRTRFDVAAYYDDNGTTIDAYTQAVSGTANANPAPYMDSDTLLVQTGVYAQDQIKFDERWALTLGGRYDDAKVDTDDRLNGSFSRQRDSKLSSHAGLVYLAANGLAPYLSYSESFVPSMTIDPSSGEAFKPETAQQYELGMRYQPNGGSDSYSIAAFDLTRQNIVSYDSNYVARQTGEIRVRGVEFAATFHPLERANVVAAWTWTPEAKVTRSANPDEVGKQANAVPRHQASLWADYRWPGGFKAGLGARYNGSNYGYGEATPVEVPSYTLYDAMLGYDFDRWSLILNARNLSDEQYLAQCSSGTCYYGDSRQLLATLTYRW